MRSWLREAGHSTVIWRWYEFMLLVLLITAKPADWQGSRYDGWNTTPNENSWQYKCDVPGCKNTFQSQEMPTYRIVCPKHRAIMTLAHDPTKG